MDQTIVNNEVVVYGDVVIINTVLIKSKNVRKFSSNAGNPRLDNLGVSNKTQLPAKGRATTPTGATRVDQLKELTDEEFRQWFVGFSDGESNFHIYKRTDKRSGFNFMFRIELHVDDIQVLYFIRERLGCGIVKIPKNRRVDPLLCFIFPVLIT
jgi:LAGLIDADG endonuclease